MLLLIPPSGAETLCTLLGVEPGTEVGDSALGEIGNILGASYLNALGSMTGLTLLPCPPQLTPTCSARSSPPCSLRPSAHGDIALVLDSELDVAGEPCAISFLLLPDAGGVTSSSLRSGWPSCRLALMENVRMGESQVSHAGDELVAIGLGSCIGLALVDRDAASPDSRTSCCPSRTATGPAGQVRGPRGPRADRRAASRAGAARAASRPC